MGNAQLLASLEELKRKKKIGKFILHSNFPGDNMRNWLLFYLH
jgi:hypothetical protein